MPVLAADNPFRLGDDPLTYALEPPPNETVEEKNAREAKEAEAKRVSDLIDESIKNDKAAMKKEKEVVKVLLLGQSESGKSTTLKNFRLKYAREAWISERNSWRSVIQLNLIKSVNTILDAIHSEMPSSPANSLRDPHEVETKNADDEATFVASSSRSLPVFSAYHDSLKTRLCPLILVEKDLKKRLGAATDELVDASTSSMPMYATPFDMSSNALGATLKTTGELVVRSWKHVLERNEELSKNTLGAQGNESGEATGILVNCKDDIKALWEDDVVQAVLKKGKVKLQDSAAFFFSELNRIATPDYEPNDDDIVRARLRTLTITEHRLKFENGIEVGREWALYDVGGSRTHRHAWLPYFDDVNAIIFLAPISCFDERLSEDNRINRLEDSFILWTAICSSKLLSKATLVLFLNKCDLLEEKIRKGISITKYLTSYGDRANDAPTLTKYLKTKFKDTCYQRSPITRTLFTYAISATDTKSMSITLISVRDGILRDHLKQSNIL